MEKRGLTEKGKRRKWEDNEILRVKPVYDRTPLAIDATPRHDLRLMHTPRSDHLTGVVKILVHNKERIIMHNELNSN